MRGLLNRQSTVAVAICISLVALTWFVFGQTIRFPFVNYDDPEYVYEVPELNHGLTAHGIAWAFSHFPSPNWYPLTNISHMIEFQCFGMNAGAFHFTNVLLHTITAVLLFLVLFQTTRHGSSGLIDRLSTSARPAIAPYQDITIWRCAFVAALFAIHPLRVESVAWVIERKDVLSGMFFMLTLAAYMSYTRKRSIARYLAMSILFACGMLSKPMLVTTPFVLLLLDYWPLKRIASRKSEVRGQLIVEKLPLFGIAFVLAFLSSSGIAQARNASEALPLSWRIGNALVSYVTYIWQMLWPVNLAPFYPHPENRLPLWEILCSGTFLFAVTAAAIGLRKTRPYFFVGWFWYLIMLAPVVGIIQVGLAGHADRYTYLPQIGLYILIVWAVADLGGRRRVAAFKSVHTCTPSQKSVGRPAREYFRSWALGVFSIAIILALAWTARAQTAYWRDSESLWRHAVAVTKNNAFAHASLADLLLRRGQTDQAIVHCEEALRIRPDDADAHNNLGLAFLQKRDERDAAEQFKKTLEIDPDHMNAMVNLAWIRATSGDSSLRDGTKAVELAEAVRQRAGHANVIVLRTLAAAYAEAGRFADAIDTAQHAVQLATVQGNQGLAEDLQRNVESYRANRPLRSR